MERKAKDNDPFVFAEKYGDKLAFVGGLDARIFETNDRDIIRREVSSLHRRDEGTRGAPGLRLGPLDLAQHALRELSLCARIYREHMLY